MADFFSKVTRRPRSKLERVLEILEPSCPVEARPRQGLLNAAVRFYLVVDGPAIAVDAEKIEALVRTGELEQASFEGLAEQERATRAFEGLKALSKLWLDGLEKLCKNDVEEAKKRLSMLPRFSPELADWVLLATRHANSVAPSKGALRMAARLGYPGSNYAAIARALDAEIPEGDTSDVAWRAHQVLRQHAEKTCHRVAPGCDRCGVKSSCSYRGANADPAGRLPNAGA